MLTVYDSGSARKEIFVDEEVQLQFGSVGEQLRLLKVCETLVATVTVPSSA